MLTEPLNEAVSKAQQVGLQGSDVSEATQLLSRWLHVNRAFNTRTSEIDTLDRSIASGKQSGLFTPEQVSQQTIFNV